MRFTIFTPTYNRAYTIRKLYDSLLKQTFHDFEWVVVDDGSTDGTFELFDEIINENKFFTVKYYKVPNGGKHKAINFGIKVAEGELFLCVDSDDYLLPDALRYVDDTEKSIPKNERYKYAGVCGLRGNQNLDIIGTTFNDADYLDIISWDRKNRGITGDKAEVIYTGVWKKYPFPTFENENFMTEGVVFDKMANDGLLFRHFNKVIRITEYLPDGLTLNSEKKFTDNPYGWGLFIYQKIKYNQINNATKSWSVYNFYKKCNLKLRDKAKALHMLPITLLIIVYKQESLMILSAIKKKINDILLGVK